MKLKFALHFSIVFVASHIAIAEPTFKLASLKGLETVNGEVTGAECRLDMKEARDVSSRPGCKSIQIELSFGKSPHKQEQSKTLWLGTPVTHYPQNSADSMRCDLGDLEADSAHVLFLKLEKVDMLRSRHYFFDYFPNRAGGSKIRVHHVGVFTESNQDCIFE